MIETKANRSESVRRANEVPGRRGVRSRGGEGGDQLSFTVFAPDCIRGLTDQDVLPLHTTRKQSVPSQDKTWSPMT